MTKLAELILKEEREAFLKNWPKTREVLEKKILETSRDKKKWPVLTITTPTRFIQNFVHNWAESEGFSAETGGSMLQSPYVSVSWGFEPPFPPSADINLDLDGNIIENNDK